MPYQELVVALNQVLGTAWLRRWHMSKDLKDVREGASPFLRCPKKRNSK